MKLAFALFQYFPYGGLERDMLAIATLCHQRGHQVTIYTAAWQGEKPAAIPVVELPVRGWSNHQRALQFSRQLQQCAEYSTFDAVIGFNKMSGLDVYYAADVCFAEKAWEERSWWYRLSNRSRTYLKLEAAVFGAQQATQIMMISQAQIAIFKKYYQTPVERFHLLPPGIRRARIMPENYPAVRSKKRQDYGLREDTLLLLMVGSDFKRKGVGRAIQSLALLPDTLRERVQLWVAGQDDGEAFTRQAKKLGVSHLLKILGPRDDISELMWSADILLHPAHSENTGTVLLEAMVAGLPVIATEVCGYANYIKNHDMGRVLSGNDGFVSAQLALAIAGLAAVERKIWFERAHLFVQRQDIFSLTEHAADYIESVALSKQTGGDKPSQTGRL